MVKKTPLVLFNASVVLSALKSDKGGSYKLIEWTAKKKIKGVISEIIVNEIVSKLDKIQVKFIYFQLLTKYLKINKSPKSLTVDKYKKVILDPGDAHVLATGHEVKADYLVSLDKKHILSIQDKVKKPKIVSPKELIEKLA